MFRSRFHGSVDFPRTCLFGFEPTQMCIFSRRGERFRISDADLLPREERARLLSMPPAENGRLKTAARVRRYAEHYRSAKPRQEICAPIKWICFLANFVVFVSSSRGYQGLRAHCLAIGSDGSRAGRLPLDEGSSLNNGMGGRAPQPVSCAHLLRSLDLCDFTLRPLRRS